MKETTITMIESLEATRPGFVLTHPDLWGFSVSITDADGMEELLEILESTDEFNRTGSTTLRAPRTPKKTTLKIPKPKIID